MMTDPINHRLAGQSWLENATDWYGQIDDSDPWEKATASAWIAGAFFQAAGVWELHQSETVEATVLDDNGDPIPAWFPPELDEDNPDTLAEDDTVESPRFHGIAYHDDNGAGYEPVAPLGHPDSYPREEPADRVRVPGFGMTAAEAALHAQAAAAIHRHDHPGRTDFYGTPGPWDAA